MKKYKVWVEITSVKEYEIEAESVEEAKELSYDLNEDYLIEETIKEVFCLDAEIINDNKEN